MKTGQSNRIRFSPPIRFIFADVINEALTLYETYFKKPSRTVYLLDYSGSMEGSGNEKMLQALERIWNQERAKIYFLQNTEQDISVFLPFAAELGNPRKITGTKTSALFNKTKGYPVG